MLNRLRSLKLSWIDIALVLLLVVGAVTVSTTSQANVNAEQENTRLEARAKAAALNLSEAEKEINLEELRQSLEEAQSALEQQPFPTLTEVAEFTNQTMQYSEENNVIIVAWSSNNTTIGLGARKYYAISHSLDVDGKPDALISFIRTLTHASVTPTIKNMNITQIRPSEGIWRMSLELAIYYR